GDMRFYLDWGMRIHSGNWTDHQAFYGLPGYAYWLAALLALTSGDLVLACVTAGGVQALAFAGVATLIFLLARESAHHADPALLPEKASQMSIWVGVLAAGAWILF